MFPRVPRVPTAPPQEHTGTNRNIKMFRENMP